MGKQKDLFEEYGKNQEAKNLRRDRFNKGQQKLVFDPPTDKENKYWGPFFDAEITQIMKKYNYEKSSPRFIDWITPWVKGEMLRRMSHREIAIIYAMLGLELRMKPTKDTKEIGRRVTLDEKSVNACLSRLRKKEVINKNREVVPVLKEWMIFRYDASQKPRHKKA